MRRRRLVQISRVGLFLSGTRVACGLAAYSYMTEKESRAPREMPRWYFVMFLLSGGPCFAPVRPPFSCLVQEIGALRAFLKIATLFYQRCSAVEANYIWLNSPQAQTASRSKPSFRTGVISDRLPAGVR